MTQKIYQIDAFSSKIFQGNPAAVCPLEEWLSDDLMQKIAMENNLSETAFFVREGEGFRIRWFTPGTEVNLCGHATLASAYVIFNELSYEKDTIEFISKSGELKVNREDDFLVLNFPAQPGRRIEKLESIELALSKKPLELIESDDYLAVFENEKDILDLSPDFQLLKKVKCRGLIVTAKGKNCDFVSRFFAPQVGINEDPVTGSAHCKLTPFWAKRLGKNKLTAKQLSKRGGELICELKNDRVLIKGKAVKYLEGSINIPN